MLHIVKQYKKLLLSFLETNLDSQASSVFIDIDSNWDKKASKEEMREILKIDNKKISDEIKKIVSQIESKIQNYQTEDAFVKKFDELKTKQENERSWLSQEQVNAAVGIVNESSANSNILSDDIAKTTVEKFDVKKDSKDLVKVKALQWALILLWYKLKWKNNWVDWDFGSSTKAALEKELSKKWVNSSVVELKEQKVVNVDITWNSTEKSESRELSWSDLLLKLSDLNNDNDLDDQNLVDEKTLKTALSKLSNWWDISKIKSIFKEITWKDSTNFNESETKEFKEKLLLNLNFLTSIWINSWLYALLSWKLSNFLDKIPTENRKIEIDSIIYSTLTPTVKNVIAWLVTTGVLVVTGWLVVVWYEETQFKWEEFISKVEKSEEGSVLSWLKSVISYIKDAFMWRRLSMSFWKDKMDVDEIESEITEFTKELLSLKLDWTDTDIKNAKLKSMYSEVINLSKKYKIDTNTPQWKKDLQKVMIQSYIMTLWEENKGSDWKATLGLLFIGLNRDNIDTNYVPTKLNATNDVESKLTEKSLNSSELQRVWIKIEKLSNWKYKHSIPEKWQTIKLDGDDRDFPIKEIIIPEWLDLENSDKIYDFKFSYKWWREDYYVLSLVERNSNSKTTIPQWSVSWTQEIGKVKNARQWKDNMLNAKLREWVNGSETMWRALYDIWHKVEFSALVKAISRWDKENVLVELNKMEKWNYKSLAKFLKNKIDSFNEWDTYMSWNSETRAKKSPKYNEIRTKWVVNAESALAKKLGFPIPSSEDNFVVKWNYSSKQISEILPWQEITSLQFMTPLDANHKNESRSSLHRVSVIDWSFSVVPKFINIDNDKKQSIIDGLLNSSDNSLWVNVQLAKLNKFLKSNKIDKQLTLPQYKDYLVNGDISKLWVDGLKLQDGKSTKFIESRAMVAWNICLNTTYAIAYPAFEIWNNKQNIAPVWTKDATAALNLWVVTWDEINLWVNPVIAALKINSNSWTPKTEVPGATSNPGWSWAWIAPEWWVAWWVSWNVTTTVTWIWFTPGG